MSEKRKVIGATVGTTLSLSKIKENTLPFVPLQSTSIDGSAPCYILEIGKEYKIYAPKSEDGAFFDCDLLLIEDDIENPLDTLKTPCNDMLADSFTLKMIGWEGGSNTFVYEYNGVLKSIPYSDQTPQDITSCVVFGATSVLLCNPDAISGEGNGKDGLTPYIKDGNWWIGETDTGVKAEGIDGVTIASIIENDDETAICFSDGTVVDIKNGKNGTNGIGISSIVKTKTNGLVDTYTITYTDETTSTFTVTNGANGTSVSIASIGEVIDETTEEVIGHTVNFSDGNTITIYNGENGKTPYIKNKTWWIGDIDTGVKAEGTNGTSVTVTNVTESTASGGSNIVTFSDGKTVTVKNGKDGKTYVLTETDKTEIAEQAIKLIDGVPDYWLSALEEGAKEINTALCTAGRNKSAFLFYTDAHWGYGSGMSPKLLKYLGKHTGINKTIFGGDFGNTYENPSTGKTMDDWADVMREWKLAIRDISNHHSVVGNHDKDISAFSTDKSLYGFLFAPEETNDIVRGGDFFYYIDDVNEKTRYFYLNTGLADFSDEQCAFLIEGLISVPSGWHIVAVSHIWFVYNSTSTPTEGSVPSNIQKVLNLLDSYNARSFGSITIESEAYDYDFSNCKGWVEFCIGGHTHVDHSFSSTMGIPIILCPTDSKHTRGTDQFVVGTTSEACVSAIVADYDNRTIKVVRVGRGTSREVEITWYEVTYNNILSKALAADGVSVYNGKGWWEDRRWSQSGQNESTSTGSYLTGWIPVKKGDVIYLKNVLTSSNLALLRSNSCGSTVGSYDASSAKSNLSAVFDSAGNLTQFTWKDGGEPYFRIMCNGISDASIITKNEPIE